MMKSLSVGIQRNDRSAVLERVLFVLLGNMFVFLFAGHEVGSSSSYAIASNHSLQTTAHTLCFTFALMALYPDEQERLYEHVKGVMSGLNGRPVGSRNLNLYGLLTSS